MPRPSARLRRLLVVVRRRERERRPAPGRLWRSVSPRYAQLWGRCFRGVPVTAEPVPYVRGFKGVSLLPPTRAADDLVVDDPPNWRPARKGLDVVDILLSAKAAPHLSESPAALADLLARWNEMLAAFWPQRS